MKKPQVMLDSGAYTAHRKGKDIDIEKYASFIEENNSDFVSCFNLDSIGTGRDESRAKDEGEITTAEQSYRNWKYLQSKGLKTIPIYHLGTDEKWLKKYLDETDYIGLGAIANLDTSQRLLGLSNIWKKYLVDSTGIPTVKVHGLGLTAIDLMLRYPWYSVDSFTPVISAVWGSVLLPKLDNEGIPYFFNMRINKISDQGDHRLGMENSYLNIPRRNRAFYEKMFTQYGFQVGMIEYQERKDRRGKKGEQERKPPKLPGFRLVFPSDPNIKTLANSWEERMRWNLVMWNFLKERLPVYPRPFIDSESVWNEEVHDGPKSKMFMGVSTMTHLDIFSMVSPKLDILISYAYMTPAIHEHIKKYVK
jgi:hypothetical protein